MSFLLKIKSKSFLRLIPNYQFDAKNAQRFLEITMPQVFAHMNPDKMKTHISVVTADHLAIRDLMTQTVCGFVGVHWHVQHIRWMHIPKVGGRVCEFSSGIKMFSIRELLTWNMKSKQLHHKLESKCTTYG